MVDGTGAAGLGVIEEILVGVDVGLEKCWMAESLGGGTEGSGFKPPELWTSGSCGAAGSSEVEAEAAGAGCRADVVEVVAGLAVFEGAGVVVCC